MAYVIRENGMPVATAADASYLTGFIQQRTGLSSAAVSSIIKAIRQAPVLTIPTKTSFLVVNKE